MNKYFWCVIAGAALWGATGVFAKLLSGFGYQTVTVVTFRVVLSCVIMFLYLTFFNRQLLKIDIKDVWYFLGSGILSLTFFNMCFFTAIRLTTISQATALLYTSPVFVVIISRFMFGEKIWPLKIAALVSCILGCFLVSGVVGDFNANFLGFAYGIGSGFGYALLNIFSKLASRKYHAFTIAFYTFLFASVVLLFIVDYKEAALIVTDWRHLASALLMSGLCCALPYVLFNIGISGIDPGQAAVYATIEPMVAAVLGFVVFNERLGVVEYIGMVFIFGGILLINAKQRVTG